MLSRNSVRRGLISYLISICNIKPTLNVFPPIKNELCDDICSGLCCASGFCCVVKSLLPSNADQLDHRLLCDRLLRPSTFLSSQTKQEVAVFTVYSATHEWSQCPCSRLAIKHHECIRKRNRAGCHHGAQLLGEDNGAGDPLSCHEAERRLLPVGRYQSAPVQSGGFNEQQICK